MGDAIQVPIIVRLQGTNADIAKELIDNSGLDVQSAIEFQEAAFAPKIYLAKSFGGFFSQKQNFAHFSSFSNLRRLKNIVCPQLLQFVCV